MGTIAQWGNKYSWWIGAHTAHWFTNCKPLRVLCKKITNLRIINSCGYNMYIWIIKNDATNQLRKTGDNECTMKWNSLEFLATFTRHRLGTDVPIVRSLLTTNWRRGLCIILLPYHCKSLSLKWYFTFQTISYIFFKMIARFISLLTKWGPFY